MANGQNTDDLRGEAVEDSESFILDLPDFFSTHLGHNPPLLGEGHEFPDAFEQAVEPCSPHSGASLGSDEVQCLLSLLEPGVTIESLFLHVGTEPGLGGI